MIVLVRDNGSIFFVGFDDGSMMFMRGSKFGFGVFGWVMDIFGVVDVLVVWVFFGVSECGVVFVVSMVNMYVDWFIYVKNSFVRRGGLLFGGGEFEFELFFEFFSVFFEELIFG